MKKNGVRRQNPARVEEVIPDYPISNWIDPTTMRQFKSVTLKIGEGKYLAALDFNPSIRAIAPTKKDAEGLLMKRYHEIEHERVANPVDDDERDHRLIQEGLKEPRRPWADVERDLLKRRRNVVR